MHRQTKREQSDLSATGTRRTRLGRSHRVLGGAGRTGAAHADRTHESTVGDGMAAELCRDMCARVGTSASACTWLRATEPGACADGVLSCAGRSIAHCECSSALGWLALNAAGVDGLTSSPSAAFAAVPSAHATISQSTCITRSAGRVRDGELPWCVPQAERPISYGKQAMLDDTDERERMSRQTDRRQGIGPHARCTA